LKNEKATVEKERDEAQKKIKTLEEALLKAMKS